MSNLTILRNDNVQHERADVRRSASRNLPSTEESQSIGFSYSGWCQTALPHRRLADDSAVWKLETDYMTLLVEPGIRISKEGIPERCGVPFGSSARLILIYLQSEALRTQCRDVELGGSLRNFLSRLGMSAGGNTSKLIQNQAERISRCRLTFHATRLGGNLLVNQNIVDMAMLADGTDNNGQRNLFVETVRLGETFYKQLCDHAVPLDERAIQKLRHSSMALDIYCWASYRLHSLDGPKDISWGALAAQFGIGIQQRKHFKPAFLESLNLAMAAYPSANIIKHEKGITLMPSQPPVAKASKRSF